MPKEIEQEIEVVSLMDDNASSNTPEPRGYEYYAAKAAEKDDAAGETGGEEGNADDDVKDTMPDKFKGKSAAEIAESYLQLESEFGRRNNEVGNLRKLTDQLLELKTSTTEKETPAEKIGVDTLLEDPDTTINKAVDDNPRLKAIEDKLTKDAIAEDYKAFATEFPKWEETLASPEFIEWAKQSPVRMKLLLDADQKYDYQAASEVFGNYRDIKGKAIEDATAERDGKARKDVKKQVTEDGSAPESKKKVFSRAELIQLKLRDPQKYERMRDEIHKAYSEKRVV